MRFFAFGLAFALVTLSSFAGAQSATSAADLRAYLGRLGFADHTAIIRDRHDRGLTDNEMTRRQQLRNIKSYETVNASRELAIEIFSRLESRLSDDNVRIALAEFTAKMLALHPLPPQTDYPESVMSQPEGNARSKAVTEWLDARRREQMESHARMITADIAGLVFGKDLSSRTSDIERIYDHVAVIVDRMYMDTLIGDTRFFGRALAALIAREERRLPRGWLARLADQARGRGFFLENVLGDRWLFETSKGPRWMPITNGSIITTRNLSAESLQISFAAVSTDKATARRAKKLGLVGKLRSYPFFVTPSDAAKGMSAWTHLRDRIQQLNLPMSAGFSHQGYAVVKEDPETGVRMSWALDAYPQLAADSSGILANTGGVRLVGIEQLLDPSHHSKIAIGNIDATKFHAWAKESVATVGYPKNGVIFDSTALELENAHPIVPQEPRRDPWTIRISQDEYRRLHSIRDPDRWYAEASDRFVNGLLDMLYRGVYFQWVTDGIYIKGGAYCSQVGFLSWLASTGVSIERLFPKGNADLYKSTLKKMQETQSGFNSADGWSWHVRTAAAVGDLARKMKNLGIMTSAADKVLSSSSVQQAQKFVKMQIVAPSGIISQEHVDVEVFDLKDRSIADRVKLSYREYHANDSGIERRVNDLLPRGPGRLLSTTSSPSESAGAAMRDVEYRMAIFGSRGVPTPGISTEEIAKAGSEAELTLLRTDWEKRGQPDSKR